MVRQLLENYWPWGRPGGGAPNSRNVGLKNVYLEEIYPVEEMQKAKRQVGNFQFGRPGGGAPHISKTGQKQIRITEDPALRFQFGDDMRKAVDNTLRYKAKREDQQQYKQQLDELVEEKKKAREREQKKKLESERNMGWTTDATVQRIQDELSLPEHYDATTRNHNHHHHHHHCNDLHHHGKQTDTVNELMNLGIELVPLIVKKRPAVRAGLGTTDVTRGDALPRNRRIIIEEPKYHHDLTKQVHHKHQRMQDDRLRDMKGSQEHFETWGGFWGRPGHGAPKSATQKGHLMSMLYPQLQPMPVH